MKKIILAMVFMYGTTVHADGPLRMKGFHHALPFENACQIMATFKSERGIFIFDTKRKKCGFGRNGLITYPHIVGNKKSNAVENIVLSPDVVDDLFDAETLKVNDFAKLFLHTYSWIDQYRTTRIYRQESTAYGWKLSINRKKWIRISFFEGTKK